jgi:preprotein translocase SecF subunit
MKQRKLCYCISAAIILIGLISIAIHGGLKYTIDFTGGLALEIAPVEANGTFISVTQVRETLIKSNIHDAEIQELPRTRSFLIKIKSEEMIGDRIVEALRADFPYHTANEDFIRSQEEVGPKAGADIRVKAVNAVLISLLCILIYIWFRFRFTWGFIAAFGLFHDTIIALGILSIVGKEIGMTVLAALLTIIGYSINNTIVLFDRIRENLKLYRKDSDYDVLNRSVNEVLNRTLVTSFTTILANVALMTFGGPVIFDFAFTFLIGIIAGTFSSIYIASGLILDIVIVIKRKREAKK